MSGEKANIELLKMEYELCHAGYNSRDFMTQDEFGKVVQSFSIFLTVLLAISIFVKVSFVLHLLLCVTIGTAGLLAMVAQLLDIESNSSCKVALRERSLQIERELESSADGGDTIQFWSVIEGRKKHKEENLFKGKSGEAKDREEVEGDLFITSSRILIAIWVLFVSAIIIWGSSLQFQFK
jgi:hypothetical protein